MKNNSKLKYLLIFLRMIILLILFIFVMSVVLWLLATILLYPVLFLVILKLSESGTLCLDLIPSWYQQITINAMGGMLGLFFSIILLRVIEYVSEENDIFIELKEMIKTEDMNDVE